MVNVEAALPPAAMQSHQAIALRTRVKAVRLFIQLCGVIVCVLFIAQGVGCFADYQDLINFWQYCRWLADGFLYVAVATFVCILEVRVFVPRVRFHLHTFASNRVAVAFVYIWIGFFSMGGRIARSKVWEPVARVNGILAWSVGIADIIMSCCSDRSERPNTEEKLCKEDGHHLPIHDASVPMELEKPDKDWPASESLFWLAHGNGGNNTSVAPTVSLKGGGSGTKKETTDPLKGMEKAEHPLGEPESEQSLKGSGSGARETKYPLKVMEEAENPFDEPESEQPLKGSGSSMRSQTTDPSKGVEKTENSCVGELESKQPPTVWATASLNHSEGPFGKLVGA